jgi:multiple sugar transport system permease protein
MVLIVPQYLTVIDLPVLHVNLLNTPWAIWLPSVANAFNIFLLKRFFDSIPQELLDAASIDGAGSIRILWSLVLPMSRPIISVVSIFALVAVWKDFLWPLLAEPSPTKQTLNAGIYSLSQGVPENVLIAASAISAVPTILFFLFFQRNIMAGLTAGSLKG